MPPIPLAAIVNGAMVKIMTIGAGFLLVWFLGFAAVLIVRSRAEAIEAAPPEAQLPPRPADPGRISAADPSQWEQETDSEEARR
jgi:hypothetical protein